MGAWRADCQILPEIFALAIRVGTRYLVERSVAPRIWRSIVGEVGLDKAKQSGRMLVSGVAVVWGPSP